MKKKPCDTICIGQIFFLMFLFCLSSCDDTCEDSPAYYDFLLETSYPINFVTSQDLPLFQTKNPADPGFYSNSDVQIFDVNNQDLLGGKTFYFEENVLYFKFNIYSQPLLDSIRKSPRSIPFYIRFSPGEPLNQFDIILSATQPECSPAPIVTNLQYGYNNLVFNPAENIPR
jgi:hypothetical protein